MPPRLPFQQGSQVEHERFGLGSVVNTEERMTIRYDDHGEKTSLSIAVTQLRKSDREPPAEKKGKRKAAAAPCEAGSEEKRSHPHRSYESRGRMTRYRTRLPAFQQEALSPARIRFPLYLQHTEAFTHDGQTRTRARAFPRNSPSFVNSRPRPALPLSPRRNTVLTASPPPKSRQHTGHDILLAGVSS